MTTTTLPKSEITCTEAPASWNTRYITSDGFECQLTLRGETGQEVLEKAQAALAYLIKNGFAPQVHYRNSYTRSAGNETAVTGSDGNGHTPESANGNGNGNGNSDHGWCAIHQCEMKRWDKDGRVWYSHKAGDTWCSGKAKSK